MSSHKLASKSLSYLSELTSFHPSFLPFLFPAFLTRGQTLLLTGLTFPQTLLTLAKNSSTVTKYPTWCRTLMRRAKEEEMKRFCKAQVRQQRSDRVSYLSAEHVQCSVLGQSSMSCLTTHRPSSED